MKKYILYFIAPLLTISALTANAQTGAVKKRPATAKSGVAKKAGPAKKTVTPPQVVGMLKTSKGSFYKIYTANTGVKPKISDVITFNFIQKTDKDSVLYNSFAAGHPAQAQVQPSRGLGDMMDVFPLLAAKDSALVKIPADSIFKGHEEARPPFFPKGSFLSFVIKMEKIQSINEAMAERNAALEKQKQAEVAAANAYVTSHGLKTTSTASGLQYVITSPTDKAKPANGDTVLVNYTGKLLNGKVFDSSIEANAKAAGLDQPGRPYEPISVVLGEGRVIPGWEEALLLLNEGSKATFIIPSGLAYGDRGSGAIPPGSTLLFDIELVKVNPAKKTK
ncbi:MAG TPA: FKBP-type peptidyl-prolyl cis-trans isomerase [Mucilaginibacter sp.]